MLHYLECGISELEVPGETSLCIYISGCINRCEHCHYPELQAENVGEVLSENFDSLLDLYSSYATCICFLGEGDCSEQSSAELMRYAAMCRQRGKRSCLYSGRDVAIEDWMSCFDYVKLGSYIHEYGSLDSRMTNQRMLKRQQDGSHEDITSRFWE